MMWGDHSSLKIKLIIFCLNDELSLGMMTLITGTAVNRCFKFLTLKYFYLVSTCKKPTKSTRKGFTVKGSLQLMDWLFMIFSDYEVLSSWWLCRTYNLFQICNTKFFQQRSKTFELARNITIATTGVTSSTVPAILATNIQMSLILLICSWSQTTHWQLTLTIWDLYWLWNILCGQSGKKRKEIKQNWCFPWWNLQGKYSIMAQINSHINTARSLQQPHDNSLGNRLYLML